MEEYASLKEVDFETYCKKCKHSETESWDEPCSECLCVAMNEGTFVPDKYEEKGKEQRKNGKNMETMY